MLHVQEVRTKGQTKCRPHSGTQCTRTGGKPQEDLQQILSTDIPQGKCHHQAIAGPT